MSDLALLLLVVVAILLLVRGPRVLPGIGAALGRGVREVRHNLDRDPADDPERSGSQHDRT